LKFVKKAQMKLDKDPFPMNMNMVELEGEESPDSAISSRDDQREGGHHKRRATIEDD
jgi:hypothetical protein